MLLGFLNTKSLVARSLVDPQKFVAHDNFNHRPILSIEFPSGNGVGQVRAMAKIYGAYASGAKTLGLKEETINELRKKAIPPKTGYYMDIFILYSFLAMNSGVNIKHKASHLFLKIKRWLALYLNSLSVYFR